MKQIIGKAAMIFANKYRILNIHKGFDHPYDEIDMRNAFEEGAKWQAKQSPWISVYEQSPDDNENIIIMCKHGAIFNGIYSNGIWFCMDGYIYDTYKGNPIYTSMCSIPPLWKPIRWMPIPKFID